MFDSIAICSLAEDIFGSCRKYVGLDPKPGDRPCTYQPFACELVLWKAQRIMDQYSPLAMFRRIEHLAQPSADDMLRPGRRSIVLPQHMNWTGWACVGVSTANMNRMDNVDCIYLAESSTGETFSALTTHCACPWGPVAVVGDTVSKVENSVQCKLKL